MCLLMTFNIRHGSTLTRYILTKVPTSQKDEMEGIAGVLFYRTSSHQVLAHRL